MTTRAELRAALRVRLEDGGATPLWDDTTLDETLAAAIRAYGVAVPRQVTTGVTVPAGATRVVTGTTIDPDRIARVTDAAGIWAPPWPPWEDRTGQRTPGQAWRWWSACHRRSQPPWRYLWSGHRRRSISAAHINRCCN